MIRAENAVCGAGSSPYSDTADFVSGEPPAKPVPPTVCIEDGTTCTAPPSSTRLRGTNGGVADDGAPKVIIQWAKGNAEDNINQFEVQILNGDGNFVAHPECDEAAASLLDEPKCALTMKSFWTGDFQMDQGTYITATVKAKNDKGWSDASRWNTSGAKVEKVPSMMNPPEGLRDESNNDVKLTWNVIDPPRDGGSSVTTYVLQFTTDVAGTWTTLLGTDDGNNNAPQSTAEYTHASAGNEKLFYKIAARNKWGTGPFSRPNLEIDVAQEPDQIDEVRINDAGMVRITWDDPANGGGSVIERYEVQVQNKAGTFVTPADTCRAGTSDIKESTDSAGNPIHLCRIDMDKMQTEFQLEYNDNIVAQVRAVNAAGLSGQYRASDDSAKVKTKPVKMPNKPGNGSSTDSDTLHVKWTKMTEDADMGGSDIIYYSVYLNDDVDSIYSTSEDFYLYEQADPSETQQSFRVAATNIYGTGEKSDLSDAIKFGSVPATLTGLKSQNIDTENTKATIVWNDPQETVPIE